MGPTLVETALEYLRTVSDLSDEQLRGYLTGWTLVPYRYRDRIAGLGLMRGAEIHFVMRPEWRIAAFRRASARAFIAPLLEKHGVLTTRVRLGDIDTAQFVMRFGFELTFSDDQFAFYALTSLPFERK